MPSTVETQTYLVLVYDQLPSPSLDRSPKSPAYLFPLLLLLEIVAIVYKPSQVFHLKVVTASHIDSTFPEYLTVSTSRQPQEVQSP